MRFQWRFSLFPVWKFAFWKSGSFSYWKNLEGIKQNNKRTDKMISRRLALKNFQQKKKWSNKNFFMKSSSFSNSKTLCHWRFFGVFFSVGILWVLRPLRSRVDGKCSKCRLVWLPNFKFSNLFFKGFRKSANGFFLWKNEIIRKEK